MFWWIDLFVILFGLVIGSFLNVCIYRIPRRQSVVRPRSRCPNCSHEIAAWENIPVLSYVLLRGRCRQCRTLISWVYPVVEVLTALAFYLLFLKYAFTPPFWINALFFSILIILIFVDLYHRILPNVLTVAGMVVGFVLVPLQSPEFFTSAATGLRVEMLPGRYLESLLGILLGGGLLWITAKLYLMLKKMEGMGLGDVKMMGMVGAFLGWKYAWLTIFAGSMVGALIGFTYILVAGKGRRYELPFGSFLGVAAVVITLWGPWFIAWYLELVGL
jgi:leader peptidase (prepilin peptidase) / N-methyltransferase